MTELGALINVLNSSHPHFTSIIEERLWGFPDDRAGVNKLRFQHLNLGMTLLLYFEHRGVKGIWAECILERKFLTREPVKYWIKDPIGFPYQIKLRFIIPKPTKDNISLKEIDSIVPIKREELTSMFKIPIFRATADRWSLYIFGNEKIRGITYPYSKFKSLVDEFEARNKRLYKYVELDHDTVKEMIYDIGQIQGKYPAKEYPIENKRIDVVWRRTMKSVPYIAFEIHIHGDLYADLMKLKHAYDLWNAIPVLIAPEHKIHDAKRWIEGSLHEIKNVFRIATLEDMKELYYSKKRTKELESKMGIL